jgi:hypothetical protein
MRDLTWWSASMAMHVPVSGSQSLMEESHDADTSTPSGSTASRNTASLWPYEKKKKYHQLEE